MRTQSKITPIIPMTCIKTIPRLSRSGDPKSGENPACTRQCLPKNTQGKPANNKNCPENPHTNLLSLAFLERNIYLFATPYEWSGMICANTPPSPTNATTHMPIVTIWSSFSDPKTGGHPDRIHTDQTKVMTTQHTQHVINILTSHPLQRYETARAHGAIQKRACINPQNIRPPLLNPRA